ncbi:MAG: transglycosylase SLT domain-containing protein [Patescibacteria group bacterium]
MNAKNAQIGDGRVNGTREYWKGLIEQYAKRYGVDPKHAVAVAQCESELRPDVYGDHGLAYGIYQFHEQTFTLFAREFKLSGLDYTDPEDSIQLAMIAFANGKEGHWTCHAKVLKRAAI